MKPFDLEKEVRKMTEEIALRREEILQAFIAKYGCDPEDLVLCHMQDGTKFWVEYRKGEYYKNIFKGICRRIEGKLNLEIESMINDLEEKENEKIRS